MSPVAEDWFERSPFGPPDAEGRRTTEDGLRFRCTMCGNCCTGALGTVAIDDAEIDALARRLGIAREAFIERYTKPMETGRSLVEKLTAFGWDCVFLDRTSVPGKAVCGLYEDRPLQCRTWPFWKQNLESERAWNRASAACPGMNHGPLHDARTVRLTRDKSPV